MSPTVIFQEKIQSGRSVSELVETVVGEYAQALGIPIHVYAPTNRLSRPRRGAGLHLHLFALPARPHGFVLWPVTPKVEMTAVFSWGLRPGTERALAPGKLFAQGVLKYDHSGRAIAGILGENIYLLFDLQGQPEELVPLLLRKTLDLCLGGMSGVLSLETGSLPHQVQIILHRLSHPTALLALDQLNARGDRPGHGDPEARVEDEGVLQKRIVVQEENVKELSRHMGSQTRLLNSCRGRLRMLSTLKEAEQSEDVLGRDIDALLNIREVRGVEVLRDRLCVLTDTIDTVVAGKRYRLGSFRLDIRFNGDVALK
ncbi:MAG: hypothetical protein ACREJP_01220, partial [Candidatus Methylomirabilales bacterium]